MVVLMLVSVLVAVAVSMSAQLQEHEAGTGGDEQAAHDRVLGALDR
jgi:hypothetical protein